MTVAAKHFKKLAFLVPRPGLTMPDFRTYWREIHGPLVAGSPGYSAYRRRYAQNHVVAAGPVGGPFPYGGMAEFELPGDGSNEEEFSATSIYRDRIRPDEAKFIDMNGTVSTTAVEEVAVEGTGAVKLVILCGKNPAIARHAFTQEMRTYVDRVRAEREFADRVCRWTLDHVVEGSFRLPGARPAESALIDCVQALWFASLSDLNQAYSSAAYREMIRPAEQRLFASPSTSSFIAEELVFFDAASAEIEKAAAT